jgi:protein transport protein SEC13
MQRYSLPRLLILDDGVWDHVLFVAHAIGANAVSWAPMNSSITTGAEAGPLRIVTGGCDNLVKIWVKDVAGWVVSQSLHGHSDWVRDVAWAPSVGGSGKGLIASAGQDKLVIVWAEGEGGVWENKEVCAEGFGDVVWRTRFVFVVLWCSWSPSGNILAVSSGDNKVSLWKEAGGVWKQVSTLGE